jgi:D-amino-acid dehydrogenase
VSEPRQAIVVGGGVIGCMTAYYLRNLGWQVRIFDSGRLGGGCSHGNCGYICPSHVYPLAMPGAIRKVLSSVFRRDSPMYLKPRFDPRLWRWLAKFASRCRAECIGPTARARHALLSTSVILYHELLNREAIQCEWRQAGMLLAFGSDAEFHEHGRLVAQLQSEFDVSASPYGRDELLEFEPALKPGLAGGWHYGGDSHLRPDQLMTELGRVLRGRGVQIEESAPVKRIEVAARRAVGVQTSTGMHRADAVVVAAGAQTPLLAASLGCRPPIEPGKGYSLTYPRPSLAPRVPIIFEDTHVAITPLETTLRVGSTMEFAGLDASINQRRIGLLRRAAAAHLREPLPEPALEEWYGWRPLTYDDLPCIGPAPAADNLFVAAGNGMIGIATGAATGKLAAQLVAGVTPHVDPAPYALSRFNARGRRSTSSETRPT